MYIHIFTHTHIHTWWSHLPLSHFSSYQRGWTALMSASADGHLEVVAMLLEKGVTVEATNNVSYCDAMYGVWRVIDLHHIAEHICELDIM
jgi:hypothetical protein